MTWQPDPADDAGSEHAWDQSLPAQWPQPASQVGTIEASPQAAQPLLSRRGWRWAAMMMLLAVGLCGLAVAAVGVVHQVLPRQFTARQQRQVMTWEMTRRWRALSAGQMFPATLEYPLSAESVTGGKTLELQARRLGIGRQSSCGSAVSAQAAQVLAAHKCTALLQATYLDSSGSMIVTVGIAILPDSSAAAAVASQLSAPDGGVTLAMNALSVPGTPAARFKDRQRQLSLAMAAGPYVIMSTAGFTDGRPEGRLRTDSYYDQEMTSLTAGLAEAAGKVIGTRPVVPSCPGAPGC